MDVIKERIQDGMAEAADGEMHRAEELLEGAMWKGDQMDTKG